MSTNLSFVYLPLKFFVDIFFHLFCHHFIASKIKRLDKVVTLIQRFRLNRVNKSNDHKRNFVIENYFIYSFHILLSTAFINCLLRVCANILHTFPIIVLRKIIIIIYVHISLSYYVHFFIIL